VGSLLVIATLLLVCSCARDEDRAPFFRDDFDDSSDGWGTDQCEEFGRGYADGEYFIELHRPNWFAWASAGRQFSDVSVEMDAYLASGSQDGHFGALCRYMNKDNFYYFAVSADGYYAIFKRLDGGDLEVLTGNGDGMVPSSAIKTGGQANRVAVTCQGAELSLYVNGELVDVVTDEAHVRGDVGVGAASGAGGDARVHFDDFVVTEP
jgi:hypothetical protein